MPSKKIFLLKGKVQHYAWGGNKYIPQLLNISNPSAEPFAEYWMGAHNSASSTIEIGDALQPLNEQIQSAPVQFLGQQVWDRFKELPYLFKILDVKEMLSIQVHPSKAEAEKGFDAEEAAGIALTDKKRNYKDRNHKPEVMVALSEFWLLHGFLVEELLNQVLTETKPFQNLLPIFKNEGYKGLYKHVMELPQQAVDAVLSPLVEAALAHSITDKSQPGYWVRKLYPEAPIFPLKNIDRGIFSIYFFNIVKAVPAEAVFQGAGVPHAYLEGQNVELMANSDNVLRGGLTPKHIDVPELLKHTTFEGIVPHIMQGTALPSGELNYPCPIEDFGITQVSLQAESSIQIKSQSPEILIVLEGDIALTPVSTSPNEALTEEVLHLFKGESAFIAAFTDYTISSSEGGKAYKAFVPVQH